MQNEVYKIEKSSIGGLNSNVMGLLCYLISFICSFIPYVKYLAWIAPLILFLIEKESDFVRFHAMQAFLLNVVNSVFIIISTVVALMTAGSLATGTGLGMTLGIGMIWGAAAFIIGIGILVFSIIAMVGAYKSTETHIPLIGNWAEKIVFKR